MLRVLEVKLSPDEQYLTDNNRKSQGWQFYFNGSDYYRIPKLDEEEKWKEVLKQFQERKTKESNHPVDEEGVKKYCLDEVSWKESTINLDKLASYTSEEELPLEYLCIWDSSRHDDNSRR